MTSAKAWLDTLRPTGPGDVTSFPSSAAAFHAGLSDLRLQELDDLARMRRDWLPAIRHVLYELAHEPSPWSHAAVADFLAHAVTAPLHLELAEELAALDPDFGQATDPQRVSPPVPLASVLPNLRNHAIAYAARPLKMLLTHPKWQFAELDGPEKLLTLANLAINAGSLRPSQAAPWRLAALGFLAEAVLFAEDLTPLLPPLLADLLARDDPAASAVGLGLVEVLCCKPVVLPVLQQAAARHPQLAELPRYQALLQAIAAEQATPPPVS